MRFPLVLTFSLTVVSIAIAQCPSYSGILVFSATSLDSAGLSGTISSFQASLGGVNNMNQMGPIVGGFRQINWDANSTEPPFLPFDMPGDFFNVNVPRGAIFLARDGKFAVSNPDDGSDDQFSSLVGLGQSQRFRTFSPPRLFTPVRENVVTTVFRIPGKNDVALVSGFGAIFTDVVLFGETKMTFYDKKGCTIATLIVPPSPLGLSFAGIISQNRDLIISKVVIKLGTVAVSPYPGSGDVVVLDDLIYGEPGFGKSTHTTPAPPTSPPTKPPSNPYPY